MINVEDAESVEVGQVYMVKNQAHWHIDHLVHESLMFAMVPISKVVGGLHEARGRHVWQAHLKRQT